MLWTPGDALDAVAVPVAATAASRTLFSQPGWLMSFLLAETTGAGPASAWLVSGDSEGGAPLIPIDLLASASSSEWFGAPGVPFEGGMFLWVVSGSVAGSVTVGRVK